MATSSERTALRTWDAAQTEKKGNQASEYSKL
jgi:hypothetical protein